MLMLKPQDAFQENLVQVLLAKLQGKAVEAQSKNVVFSIDEKNWELSASANLNWETYNYRVVQRPLLNAAQWNLIHPDYKWAAKDGNGEIYLFSRKPHIIEIKWIIDYRGKATFCPFKDLDPDDIYWRDSLQERPSQN